MKRSHVIALLCALAPLPAMASSFVLLDLPDLIRGADGGIHAGRVLETRSAWNAERTMIWTEATVLVTEDLGGGRAAGRTIEFRVPGGRVGDFTLLMEGAPRFETGQQVVVFATSWPNGAPMVLGYFQGLSQQRTGPDGRTVLEGGSAGGLTLPQLREAIRAHRAGGGGQR